MKKIMKYCIISIIVILALLAIWLLFNGGTLHILPLKENTILENVTMTIKEGTLTKSGATIIITDLSNENNTYGDWFRIDKLENNKWVQLETIISNYGFNDIGYNVDENKKLEMKVDWSWLYGELENGTYRLVKDAAVVKEDNYVGNKYIYVEFTLNY